MDYKYIEQLIERYFDCQTTLQEEQILRSFFAQEDVPVRLLHYADLFKYEQDAKEQTLGEDFDAKVMAAIEALDAKSNTVELHPANQPKPAQPLRKRHQMYPFYRAAAIVAVVITISNAAQTAFRSQSEDTPAVTVNPYMTKDEVASIKGVNNSQAESKVSTDSILAKPVDNK